MRRILLVIPIIIMTASFTACGNASNSSVETTSTEMETESISGAEETAEATIPETSSGSDEAVDSASLKDLMIYVVENAGNETEGDWDYFSELSTAEDAAYVVGADSLDCSFTEGITYTGVIGAFDCAMFRTKTHEDAMELAALLEENANLQKYVCQFAEAAKTSVRGNVVLFVMSTESTVESYLGYFDSYGK